MPANVSYAGTTATLDPNAALDQGAVYTVTVDGSVKDLAGNPLGSPDSWSFTTAALTNVTDTTVSDFSAGAPGTNTYVSETDNGEVTLKPTEGQEFSGSSLPAGWQSCTWPNGPLPTCTPGGSTVSGGSLHVQGAIAGTNATFGSGRSLEFVATFGAAGFQHVGFGVDVNTVLSWAMFSTGSTNNSILARTRVNGGTEAPTTIPGVSPGTPHLFRIEWDTTEVRYYVDGNPTPVATHPANFGTIQMRPIASDFTPGGPELSTDWLRMSPYPASGTFDSRVFDAGQTADWGALSWNSATPSGTGIAISVRTGNSPIPDETWSAFTPMTSGGDIPGSSRYVQYRAELSSTDPGRTPTLTDVSISY